MTVSSNSSALFSPQSAVVPPKMRVLFVEDDDECREALSAELGDHGLDVESFRDGRSMLDGIAADADADVALLDWNLPDIPGIDLALELNRRSVKFPIVFLTGQALGTSHEMLAFERGALDFIDKSRGVPVIVKRLRTITRPGRAKPEFEPERLICQGRLTLRPKVSRALWDGMDVDLTVTEYRIVKLLVVEAGRFFSYRQVYDCMHYAGFMAGCGDDGYRVNVRSAMKRIRNKFRVFAPGFAEIENHPGLGYRWRPRD
jgi:two-component system, OmpR family, response regulator ChvI